MKTRIIFPLTVLAGVLALGYASNKETTKEAKAISAATYIEMNEDAFTNWTDEAGELAYSGATFWNEHYSFNALDNFFRGESKEGWTGSLTLKSWKQYTQYIYFQWGGANNIDDSVRLEFHYGDYSASALNDTFSENPMLLRYFKIPDEEYANLDHENGFDMYITLVDGRTSNYAFHNFGYLHVNQTADQVSDAMRYYLNHIDISDTREWKVNNTKAIYNHYYGNSYLKEVFLRTASNIDEDFEDVDSFLNHWYLDYNYDNFRGGMRTPDKALCDHDTRDSYESNMPYNKTGESFFSGWHEGKINQGYVNSDDSVYRFISRPFVLGGTGLVSVKMSGQSASLHVIDAETQEELAWADLKTYEDKVGEENKQYLGFNTVTMVRHYINLSYYLGRTIQLALADVYDAGWGWASSNFDELVANYETYPSLDVDVVKQENETVGETYQYYFDQYTSSNHIVVDPDGLKYKLGPEEIQVTDDSSIYQAYKFLKNYYSSLRSPENEFDLSKATEEVRRDVYYAYRGLDSAAQQIVDKSTDVRLTEEFSEEWYKNPVDTSKTVSDTISELASEFDTYTVSFNSNGGTGSMTDVTEVKGEYELPNCLFTAPEDKEFEGWKVNGEGDLLQPGDKINVTANVEIVAQWKEAEKDPLADIKAAAKEELEYYFDDLCSLNEYRSYQFEELYSIYRIALSDIENATSEYDINYYLEEAKAALDDVETAAEASARELGETKYQAVSDLEAYRATKNDSEYRQDQIDEMDAIVDEGKEAIYSATTATEVYAILDEAKAALDAVKTDAELIVEEFADYQINAKQELVEYRATKVDSNYRQAQVNELNAIVTSANTAIDNATTTSAIDTIVTNAKSALDAVKTDAQLLAEELAVAKNAAKAEINEKYSNLLEENKYDDNGKAALLKAKDDAIRNIEAATTINEVNEEKAAGLAALEAVPTYKPSSSGCMGSITTSTAILSIVALLGVVLITIKKIKQN